MRLGQPEPPLTALASSAPGCGGTAPAVTSCSGGTFTAGANSPYYPNINIPISWGPGFTGEIYAVVTSSGYNGLCGAQNYLAHYVDVYDGVQLYSDSWPSCDWPGDAPYPGETLTLSARVYVPFSGVSLAYGSWAVAASS